MQGRKKLNKYEREVMSGLHIITGLFILLTIVNLVVPLFVPMKFGYSTIFTYIAIAFHIYGVAEAWGFGSQAIPAAQIILTRFMELCYYFFISKYDIVFLVFLIVVGLDAMLLLLEHMDRSKYEYIREREE